jgi:preprotein translocase subunit YajC
MTELLAAQGGSGSGSLLTLLIFMVPLGLLFLFMRNQQKRVRQQQSQQQAAGVGEDILTTSGIFGTIVDEDEDEGTVIVEIAPGTRIKMVRAGIARRVVEDDEYDEADDEDDEQDRDDDADEEPDENAQGPIRS